MQWKSVEVVEKARSGRMLSTRWPFKEAGGVAVDVLYDSVCVTLLVLYRKTSESF